MKKEIRIIENQIEQKFEELRQAEAELKVLRIKIVELNPKYYSEEKKYYYI